VDLGLKNRRALVTAASKGLGRACAEALAYRLRQLAAEAGGNVAEELKRRAAGAPTGRYGEPDEFGAACAFLCSRQAGYITGQTIGIDGGALAGVH
jgi:3-oxoacyl-[acyl-carrier protein] reductase